MMNRNIYLNDFRAPIVLSVIDELINKDNDLTVSSFFSLSLAEAQDYDFLILSWESMLHRLFIYPLKLDEPIFPNPDVDITFEIASRNAFIKAVRPSEEFKLLMTSKYE